MKLASPPAATAVVLCDSSPSPTHSILHYTIVHYSIVQYSTIQYTVHCTVKYRKYSTEPDMQKAASARAMLTGIFRNLREFSEIYLCLLLKTVFPICQEFFNGQLALGNFLSVLHVCTEQKRTELSSDEWGYSYWLVTQL